MRMYGKSAFALVALASVTFMGVARDSSLAAGIPQVNGSSAIRSVFSASLAQRGSLDPAFGNAGKVVTIGTVGPCRTPAALQPDGKIVVVDCVSNNQLQLVRYLANGSLDRSFGRGGIDVTSLNASPLAVALQTDGKILVFASLNGSRGVVRFNSNGTLDAAFGKGGIAAVTLPSGQLDGGIVVQSDGRIVVGAEEDNGQTATVGLVRFLPNGTFDSTFGKNGIALINGPGQVTALAVALDGTTDALVSDVGSSLGEVVYPVHVSANGSFIAAPPSGNLALISTLSSTTFQPDAQIIFVQGAGGHTRALRNVRLTKFNTPDPTFQRPVYFFGTDIPSTTMVEPNGGILTAGGDGLTPEFDLARFNPNGSLDTGFGSGGIVNTRFFTGLGGSVFLSALLFQPDGKIVAVGAAFNGANQGGIALARYFGP